MIAILVIGLFLCYALVNVLYVVQRNYRAHQFFKFKSPQLPVLPNPHIFFGNVLDLTWKMKNYKLVDEMHDKYGQSFGFYMCNQPWVFTKDLDLIKLIEVDKAHKHINKCKLGLPIPEFSNSIWEALDDDWRKIRRAVAPALTNHKVRSEEVSSVIKTASDKLIDSFRRREQKARLNGDGSFEVDIHNYMQRFTMSVIMSLAYKQDDIIDFNSEKDSWVDRFEKGKRDVMNPVLLLSLAFPFIRPLCCFLTSLRPLGHLTQSIVDFIIEATDINRTAREHHKRHQKRMSVTVENYKERSFSELKSSGNFKRRLVDTIIDSYLDRKIKHDDFVASTYFLFIAGFETTASTLSSLCWNLMINQDVQEKLRKAIVNEGIDADYIQWCLMEAVRWHPAVPMGTGRILGEDVTVNGLTYAKGTFVMPSTWSIHHDSNIWPEHEKFKPERWMRANEFHPAAFVGFGLGPRNCVGGKLAMQEMRLAIKAILTNYRLDKCPSSGNAYDFSCPGLIYTILDRTINARLVPLESSTIRVDSPGVVLASTQSTGDIDEK